MKNAVQKVSECKYVLPKIADMRVEATAFMSEALFEASDRALWNQLATIASYPGVTSVYAMPDAHAGVGIPVGIVAVTEDTLIQSVSGFDISCGVIYAKATLNAGSVRSKHKRREWIDAVEKRVALGPGHSRPKLMPKFDKKKTEDVLREGALALGVDPSLCERASIPISRAFDHKAIDRAWSKASDQLGSVGGGNHFVELQCDSESGEVFIMLHCGSRGYGYQTAEHFFYKGAELRGLAKNRREQSWLRIDEELGKQYWEHHNSAANYAIANRHVIMEGLREATQEVFDADIEVYYEISHNLIQEETLVLPDGTTKKGFVHRKGTTRAMPAQHPDLKGTRWEETGHPCLIPGSMYDGAVVLFPLVGAHESACSVNHGSGRVMARGEAKRKLEHKQERIDDEMANVQRQFGGTTIEGILTNGRHVVLDECRHVYKDLDAVIATLQESGIARVDRRLYPIANIKAGN